MQNISLAHLMVRLYNGAVFVGRGRVNDAARRSTVLSQEVTQPVIEKQEGSRPGTVRVVFLFPANVLAQQVHVVGDFNDWNRSSHPMARNGNKVYWHLELELARGKAYQFRYLLDGKVWQNDWQADRYAPNPFGGENSVVQT